MATITTRQTTGNNATAKNAPLSNSEMDTNLISLNDEVNTLLHNANKYAGELSFLYLEMIKAMPGLKGYWPAVPAYLFEDSAGAIPASVGGVVGLLLDIRQGLAIGPDLVDTANLATAWVRYGNNVIEQDGDAVKVTYVDSLTGGYVELSAAKGLTQNLVVGNRLVITGEVAIVSGSATLVSAGGLLSPIINITESSFTPFSITSTVYVAGPYLRIDCSVGGVAKIRNIAVRLVLGNHAVQNTTANKPYLRKTPTSGVHWLDSNTSTSALTATLGNLGAACTVARAGAEGVTFTEGVTISSTYNIAPAYGFNGDVAIFNRALTVTEKALLTRYMQRGVPVLGANLITNGTFDTDTTGWTTTAATSAIVNGQAVVTNTGTVYGKMYQSVAVSANSYYLVKADAAKGTAASTSVYASSDNASSGALAFLVNITTQATATLACKATTPSLFLLCINSNTNNGTGSYDNASIRSIT